jgi:hypothetical protein
MTIRHSEVDTAAIRREPLSHAYIASPELADIIDTLCDEVDRLTDALAFGSTMQTVTIEQRDAARAEVDRLTETLDRVRALADEWSKSPGVASFVAIGAGLGQLLDGPAPADPDVSRSSAVTE